MAEKELDIEKESKRVARKSNLNMRKSEYSFEKRLSRLDKEIDDAINDKIKMFDGYISPLKIRVKTYLKNIQKLSLNTIPSTDIEKN